MEEPRKVPIKVQVKDKRRVARDESKAAAEPSPAPEVVEGELVEPDVDRASPEEAKPDYLGDLQRLQAEFANYRKRMMAQNAEAASRGAARLVEKLLPVLDNFELAIAHGEGGAGVEMVFKELRSVLEAAGLEEVPGEGAPFDYHVHEAVDSREDDSVEAETVRTVHRRGYTMNGSLVRAAMVGVSKPPAPATVEPAEEPAPEEAGAPADESPEA